MVGEWKDCEPGDRLLATGKATDAICIAISGDLEIRKGSTVIGRLQPGETIGLALAFTEEPSSVDAALLDRWPLCEMANRKLARLPRQEA